MKVLLNPSCGTDEIYGVVVVGFDAGGDGEYVGVEYDVGGGESHFVDKKVVGTRTYCDSAFIGVGLALFVKCHHHYSRSHLSNSAGVGEEWLFAFFQAYGIYDRSSLNAFQSRFNGVPFR